MLSKSALLATAVALAPICIAAQTPASAAAVWNALSAPAMDPAKSAHAENVVIVRDAIRITLVDGAIQFLQPVNGIVFGAVFRGNGRLGAVPPNPLETHQLLLFTKQSKLDMTFHGSHFLVYGYLRGRNSPGGQVSSQRARQRRSLCQPPA